MGRKPVQTVKRKTRSVSTENQETLPVSTENQKKTFLVLTDKLWFTDGQKIKVGESMSGIMSGEVKIIDIKEILAGENYNTWKIIVDKEDKIYLLKTSRELK
jgi:hypothetical protein